MELYQFSWSSGSDDECYMFYIDTDSISVVKLLRDFKDAECDVSDYDEFESFVEKQVYQIYRHYHEEPTYIHEEELVF